MFHTVKFKTRFLTATVLATAALTLLPVGEANAATAEPAPAFAPASCGTTETPARDSSEPIAARLAGQAPAAPTGALVPAGPLAEAVEQTDDPDQTVAQFAEQFAEYLDTLTNTIAAQDRERQGIIDHM